ncbi:META domain-containing protein [Arundinibacter roseus]|uniref:META domain-containing protein n=2 Tax=Arundinibacter roseus TaxID=2070510 RepID=A0A4R4K7A0_9BACT|nr:META domain-containing protein [Arundinibacter roseus]
MRHLPIFSLLCSLLATSSLLSAQSLRPGFDKNEYLEMLKISANFGDSSYVAAFPKPERFDFVYRSPVVGLDNRWDLWVSKNKMQPQAVLSLRGTTANSVSWLGNFYAAMVPAKGELTLSKTDTFLYKLAEHPAAAVHVGWLVSTAFLVKDIWPKIDSCYATGTKDFLIMGHSQGGAIAYLLTAYLHHLQQNGQLPADLRLKTYCSAGPKPGNLYFAYDYEAATQGGWAFNVVNSADWVPEVPMSIQTLEDFNVTNPFVNAKGIIKKQKLPKRVAMKYVYNRLSKPSRRAQKNYQKYLGTMTADLVSKNLSGYVPSMYYNSNNYVRTGTTVVLLADEEYMKEYPDNPEKIFVHHFHPPYLALTQKLNYPENSVDAMTENALSGTWEATFVSSSSEEFEALYPNKKPTLTFDLSTNRVSGNSGCNSLNGPVEIQGNSIQFSSQMAMTRMFCPGAGETIFLKALAAATTFSLENQNTLHVKNNGLLLMSLRRK